MKLNHDITSFIKDLDIFKIDAFEYLTHMGEIRENFNNSLNIKIEIKIDHRAPKKINRWDKEINENIHWIELVNVRGDKGWLYGDIDYFCFETSDYLIYIEKKKLQSFIAFKCKDKIKTETKDLYKLYTRKNRKDKITLVKTIDLMFLSDSIISKKDILNEENNCN